MLNELRLENFVLFDLATFPFAPGLNVISGETGAGKSLVAAALSQALGARALPEHIRRDADQARVTAVFVPAPAVRHRLPDDARPDPGAPLVFDRLLRREGASRLTLAGRAATAPVARAAAAALVDFAAQHETVRLADPAYQRELLDRFGQAESEAAAFAERYAAAQALARRLAAGDAEQERVRRRAGDIRELLDRFDAFAFDPERDPQLEDRIKGLAKAAALAETAARARDWLYDADDAIVARLEKLRKETRHLADAVPMLAEADERLTEGLARLDEAARLLQNAADDAEGAADDLDRLITRSEALKALAKRLGASGPDRVAERVAALRAEWKTLSEWDADEDAVRAELAKRLPPLREAGLALSKRRAEAAKKLSRVAGRELADLEMEQAAFQVRLEPRWTDADGLDALLDAVDAGGLESVEFLLAANPGESPARLAGETSGGESARALLALKAALGDVLGAPVLFLDEVDAGVGGRLGASLGGKLRKLAKGRQVICITHLPQIAAGADHHLKIAKAVRKGRTVATVAVLREEARLEEIALMIHGRAATGTTRQQAREMLEAARE